MKIGDTIRCHDTNDTVKTIKLLLTLGYAFYVKSDIIRIMEVPKARQEEEINLKDIF